MHHSHPSLRLLLVWLLMALATGKTIKKTFSPADFATPSRFVFLTKFHIGVGSGQIDITYQYNQSYPARVAPLPPKAFIRTCRSV